MLRLLRLLLSLPSLMSLTISIWVPTKHSLQGIKSSLLVSWSPPPTGFIKINTDGSMRKYETARAASIIRNSNKVWTSGTSRKFFGVGALTAELWAILIGCPFVETWVTSVCFLNQMPRKLSNLFYRPLTIFLP